MRAAKSDENGIDGEEKQRTKEEVELQRCQSVTSRADRGHQSRGDCHTGDHIAFEAAAHSHNTGQTAKESDDHIIRWDLCEQAALSVLR